jgi:signal peptidase I
MLNIILTIYWRDHTSGTWDIYTTESNSIKLTLRFLYDNIREGDIVFIKKIQIVRGG